MGLAMATIGSCSRHLGMVRIWTYDDSCALRMIRFDRYMLRLDEMSFIANLMVQGLACTARRKLPDCMAGLLHARCAMITGDLCR